MSNPTPTTERPSLTEKRFQNYRGTWAWIIQRFSAIGLFLLIPLKIYTGWASRDMVPYPESWMSAKKIHVLSKFGERLDIAMILFFLLHAFYGVRVILMDFGLIKANSFFWRTLIAALGLCGLIVWYVYIHKYEAP